MTWFITQKPSFLSDYSELPRDLQKRVSDALEDLEQDAVTPRGNTIKPLKGYENLWRYRLGEHRLIYAAVTDRNLVQMLAVGPRGTVYERFNYTGWDDESYAVNFGPGMAAELKPHQEALPEWVKHPEWFKPEPEKPASAPLPHKLTPSRLQRWRVPEKYHDVLMRCLSEDDLMAAPVPSEVLGPVLEALWPATVEKLAQEPDLVLFDPTDLERYAAGELHAFLLNLDEHQQRFTDWAMRGPTLVKGGPGSGKSTVALYRVRALLEQGLAAERRLPSVLFTTYTNALVNVSESLLRQLLRDPLGLGPADPLPKNVTTSTVDRLVVQIVRRSGYEGDIAAQDEMQMALRTARGTDRRGSLDLDIMLLKAAIDNLRDDYLLDEFEWVIEGQNCRTLADYLEAQRVGRGIPFNERTRRAVWKVYEAYSELLRQMQRRTWGQLRQMALEAVQNGRFTRRWDYVVVDEAQDLTPTALALCVELARDPSGIFLTADANQSLYNRGFRWQSVHEQLQVVGRTRILRRNYRTTREIAEAAAQILSVHGDTDREALQQEFIHSGVSPQLYAAKGAPDQANWLAGQILGALRELRLPLSAAAVLVPNNYLAEQMARLLQNAGLQAAFMRGRELSLDAPGVKVTTLHSAKGLEFPVVAVAHVEAGQLPRDFGATDAEERAEAEENQRRLFFVGCTRAMRYLMVTHDEWAPSPFLERLTEDHWYAANE